ncbi:hypothetical protein GCM10011274_39430 [Paraglaciecola chathamensis]|uniref:Uncharacterized protein n=1 Tax=Paraglaciecola chathamensis TaxID=368405 RepID=A0A8H9IF04_9ALTE|nr:hypothetical protein GCM10011274_39430 [Paraglaciecola oceanifecundans]
MILVILWVKKYTDKNNKIGLPESNTFMERKYENIGYIDMAWDFFIYYTIITQNISHYLYSFGLNFTRSSCRQSS